MFFITHKQQLLSGISPNKVCFLYLLRQRLYFKTLKQKSHFYVSLDNSSSSRDILRALNRSTQWLGIFSDTVNSSDTLSHRITNSDIAYSFCHFTKIFVYHSYFCSFIITYYQTVNCNHLLFILHCWDKLPFLVKIGRSSSNLKNKVIFRRVLLLEIDKDPRLQAIKLV